MSRKIVAPEQSSLPEKGTQKEVVQVAIGVIRKENQVLLAIRPAHVPSPGRWEFPGGKIEKNETPLQALHREMQEEIGITVITANFWQCFDYQTPEKTLCLHVFFIEQFEGTPQGCEGQVVAWRDIADLADLSFPPANAALNNSLRLILYN